MLILGGTAEAWTPADLLVRDGVDIISSLAGRVAQLRLPVGKVCVGGFGGVDGLASFLAVHEISAVVDATHPFSQRMSANAVAAYLAADVPLLRLRSPARPRRSSGRPRTPGSWRWCG